MASLSAAAAEMDRLYQPDQRLCPRLSPAAQPEYRHQPGGGGTEQRPGQGTLFHYPLILRGTGLI